MCGGGVQEVNCTSLEQIAQTVTISSCGDRLDVVCDARQKTPRRQGYYDRGSVSCVTYLPDLFVNEAGEMYFLLTHSTRSTEI